MTPRSVHEWAAAVTVWFGLGGLFFCLVLWALTDRVSPALLATFGGLAGVGQAGDALVTLLRSPPAPPPAGPPAIPDTTPRPEPRTDPEAS